MKYFIVGQIHQPIHKSVIGLGDLSYPGKGKKLDPCPWFSVNDKIDKEKTEEDLLPERPLINARPVGGSHADEFEIREDIYSY